MLKRGLKKDIGGEQEMPSYLVRFTPLEPYFFGNEKSFAFGEVMTQKSGNYFVSSEDTPSQTAILGSLRYCCLDTINEDYSFDKNVIGPCSFKMTERKQNFGVIRSISPMFLTDGRDYYLKTPFDHIMRNCDSNGSYTPFQMKNYKKVSTSEGSRYLPQDYVAKEGIADSYVNLRTREISTGLFSSNTRVGIKKSSVQEGFFKREYKILEKDFSFAVFAVIEKNMQNKIIYMGQGKSVFSVTFEEKSNNFLPKVQNFFKNHDARLAFAISDLYVSKDIYQSCYFVNTKIKEHRTFETVEGAQNFFQRFKKGTELIHLLQVGSMFWVKDFMMFSNMLCNENCQQIGLNAVIRGGADSEDQCL